MLSGRTSDTSDLTRRTEPTVERRGRADGVKILISAHPSYLTGNVAHLLIGAGRSCVQPPLPAAWSYAPCSTPKSDSFNFPILHNDHACVLPMDHTQYHHPNLNPLHQ